MCQIRQSAKNHWVRVLAEACRSVGITPEIPEDCVVAAAGHDPALFPAALSDPRELAFLQGRPAHQLRILCLQAQQPRRRPARSHPALEPVCLLLLRVLFMKPLLRSVSLEKGQLGRLAEGELLMQSIQAWQAADARQDAHLVGCLDNHEVVASGSQDPFAVIGDVHSRDGRAQAGDGRVGARQ